MFIKKHPKMIILISGLFLCLIILFYAGMSLRAKETKVFHVYYIPKIIDENNDFWTSLISGANSAASEYQLKLTIQAPDDETDYATQNQLILNAIKEKPDVLVVSPISTTKNSKALQKVNDAGIPLIFIDSSANECDYNSLISTDNFNAGMEMGKYVQTLINKDSKIAIVAHVKNASTALDRAAGLRAGLGSNAYQIIDTVYCDSNYEKARVLTKKLLKKHPDIEVIVGLNEYSAVGAGRAINELGLSGDVKIIGFDNSIESIQYLEQGTFDGLEIQNAYNMGYLGIETAWQLLKGQAYESYVDSGANLITRDNMYDDANQKLLFAFLNVD